MRSQNYIIMTGPQRWDAIVPRAIKLGPLFNYSFDEPLFLCITSPELLWPQSAPALSNYYITLQGECWELISSNSTTLLVPRSMIQNQCNEVHRTWSTVQHQCNAWCPWSTVQHQCNAWCLWSTVQHQCNAHWCPEALYSTIAMHGAPEALYSTSAMHGALKHCTAPVQCMVPWSTVKHQCNAWYPEALYCTSAMGHSKHCTASVLCKSVSWSVSRYIWCWFWNGNFLATLSTI